MSEPRLPEPRRVMLAGATGLVGSEVMRLTAEQPWLRLVALTRREAPMPPGARMEMMIANPARWDEAVATIAPTAVICALGTTISTAGSEEAFRAVDFDLVLAVATAAKATGVETFVLVSSAGANAHAKTFYLQVKGEIETAITKLRFRRLDLLRPGLLRGSRPQGFRPLEALGRLASPLTDLALHGDNRRWRSIPAETVARAAVQCAREKVQGRFQHDNDSLLRFAKKLPVPE
jgi:uncharacterized protein YbjT (DUF2867 family)